MGLGFPIALSATSAGGTPVLLLSAFGTAYFVSQARKNGAAGYLRRHKTRSSWSRPSSMWRRAAQRSPTTGRTSDRSATTSWQSCAWWRRACRTRRSAGVSCARRGPSRRTSSDCSRDAAATTGPPSSMAPRAGAGSCGSQKARARLPSRLLGDLGRVASGRVRPLRSRRRVTLVGSRVAHPSRWVAPSLIRRGALRSGCRIRRPRNRRSPEPRRSPYRTHRGWLAERAS